MYMNCPLEIAESFLRKWKDEQTVLVVNLLGYGFSSTLGATVSEFDINEGVVFAALAVKDSSGVTTAPGNMTIGLRCASFEYLDSREAPEPLRGAEEMFDGILKAKIFNYEEDETPLYTLTLTEMRSQPS
jgi:hypothetical protein